MKKNFLTLLAIVFLCGSFSALQWGADKLTPSAGNELPWLNLALIFVASFMAPTVMGFVYNLCGGWFMGQSPFRNFCENVKAEPRNLILFSGLFGLLAAIPVTLFSMAFYFDQQLGWLLIALLILGSIGKAINDSQIHDMNARSLRRNAERGRH